jgi:hypothetical protein
MHGGDRRNTSATNDFKAASPRHPLFGASIMSVSYIQYRVLVVSAAPLMKHENLDIINYGDTLVFLQLLLIHMQIWTIQPWATNLICHHLSQSSWSTNQKQLFLWKLTETNELCVDVLYKAKSILVMLWRLYFIPCTLYRPFHFCLWSFSYGISARNILIFTYLPFIYWRNFS